MRGVGCAPVLAESYDAYTPHALPKVPRSTGERASENYSLDNVLQAQHRTHCVSAMRQCQRQYADAMTRCHPIVR